MTGIEPATPCVQGKCSSQLSYIPKKKNLEVRLDGLEPTTPALSEQCSNQLSYKRI